MLGATAESADRTYGAILDYTNEPTDSSMLLYRNQPVTRISRNGSNQDWFPKRSASKPLKVLVERSRLLRFSSRPCGLIFGWKLTQAQLLS
jgi:hypothetical protein